MEVVQANGLEIAYKRVGEGRPLVFLHGAAGDGRVWQPQLASLADEFTVVAWDEPGAGRSSDLPGDFGLADYASCLAALIEALALGPAHVAGLSWGGTVALELYRSHPELVATLILADTYAGWKGSLPQGEVRARVAGAREMLAAPASEFDPTLPGLFAGDPPPEFVPLLAQVAADVRPESLRTQLSVMAEADQRDLLPRIAVPTLLIWGELDARSPLDVARQFEQAIPDPTLVVIPGSGHVSNLDRPERFNLAVREFCRAVTEQTRPTDDSAGATIRWASVGDARAIAAVHIASWRAAYRGLMPDAILDELTIEGRERDWQGWLAEEGERRFTLVAERDDRIEAFCTLEMPSRDGDEPDGVAGVPALYAHPDAFGRGAGPALLDAAIEAMRERGYRESILWMLEGNRRAEAFYERRGWARDGGRRPAEYPGLTYASEAERPLEVRLRRSLEPVGDGRA